MTTAWGWGLARLDVGVAVFFVLSGFLLYRPFAVAHQAGEPGPALGRYARNRVLRIYPAWWVVLAAVGLVMHRIRLYSPVDGILYATLLIGFRPSHFVGNGLLQSWTLTVEVCFYAFLPVYAAAVARWSNSDRMDRRYRHQLLGVTLLLAGGVATRVIWAALDPGGWVLLSLPGELFLFGLGMAAAVVSARTELAGTGGRLVGVITAAGRRPWLCWAAAGVAFWALATQAGLPRQLDLTPLTAGEELTRHLLFGAVALCLLAPGLFPGEGGGPIRRLLASPPLRLLGLVSYGIYLWHLDLERWLTGPGRPLEHWAGGRFAAILVLALVTSVVAAGASYALVERPARRLRVPLTRARPEPRVAA